MAASAVNGGSKGGADASHATIKSSGRVPGRVVRQHPWSLHYLVLRIVAILLRSVVTPLQRLGFLLEPALPSTVQCDKISIPSREPHRRIRAHVYRPRRVLAGTKLPVHVNFHGSGFVLPSLGQDSFFCAQLAERFNAVVVDCDYRKGPEAPYPAGVEDAEDAAAWLASGPKTLPPLDLDLLTCSGFSAGGNIALVLALKLSPRRCAGLATLYPPTELHLPDDKNEYKVKVPPNPNFKYGVRLPRPLNLFFRKAYIVKGTDDNVKWLSPLNAEVEEFPKVVHICCGDGDKLHDEGQLLIRKLHDGKHPDATFYRIAGGGHGFDKAQRSAEGKAMRDEAYEQMYAAIQRAHKAR